jgi:hypothetical protein
MNTFFNPDDDERFDRWASKQEWNDPITVMPNTKANEIPAEIVKPIVKKYTPNKCGKCGIRIDDKFLNKRCFTHKNIK